MTSTPTNPLCVQFGCGLDAPDGWRNFDVSPTLQLQRLPLIGSVVARARGPRWPASAEYGDILTGLPIATGTADAVYCSHVLDHLAREDGLRAIREAHRMLRPGGVFRLVLHDLEHMARTYLGRLEAGDAYAAYAFMRESILGQERRSPRGLGGLDSALREWRGNHRHRWMWDEASLSAELRTAGFRTVRRARFGDCTEPGLTAWFERVEREGRWRDDLGLEAVK